MYDQFADDPNVGTGYRVMTYCRLAGWVTWAIDERCSDAIADAARLRFLGNSAEVRTRNYERLSQDAITAAIAAEKGTHHGS